MKKLIAPMYSELYNEVEISSAKVLIGFLRALTVLSSEIRKYKSG